MLGWGGFYAVRCDSTVYTQTNVRDMTSWCEASSAITVPPGSSGNPPSPLRRHGNGQQCVPPGPRADERKAHFTHILRTFSRNVEGTRSRHGYVTAITTHNELTIIMIHWTMREDADTDTARCDVRRAPNEWWMRRACGMWLYSAPKWTMQCISGQYAPDPSIDRASLFPYMRLTWLNQTGVAICTRHMATRIPTSIQQPLWCGAPTARR